MKKKSGKSASAPRQVRIIGGTWKRTPLSVPDVEGLRPTPDRVRETVFNWLGHLQAGGWHQIDCLDLFAGTGALGLVGNVVWFVLAGWWLAIGHLCSALACFVTIIGIPFGIQHIKLALIALAPIGKTIVSK